MTCCHHDVPSLGPRGRWAASPTERAGTQPSDRPGCGSWAAPSLPSGAGLRGTGAAYIIRVPRDSAGPSEARGGGVWELALNPGWGPSREHPWWVANCRNYTGRR